MTSAGLVNFAGNQKSRASIRDVARLAGVSPSCASNVLGARRPQDDSIGRAVTLAARELGYRRNTMASSLRAQQSRIAGLVVPDLENPFFASLVTQLELRAELSGYRIVTASSRENPEVELREIDELQAWRAAGILLIPARRSEVAKVIDGSDTPFVLLDRQIATASSDEIGVNNREASRDVMERIVALGHRHILVLYSNDSEGNMQDRLRGIDEAIRGRKDITVHKLKTGMSVDSARDAIDIFQTDREPTAIFSLYNPATLAAYGHALKQGHSIGKSISLVGFDDSKWMQYVYPPISAVSQPVEEIAQSAWDRFISRTASKDGERVVRQIACKFTDRGSLNPPEDRK